MLPRAQGLATAIGHGPGRNQMECTNFVVQTVRRRAHRAINSRNFSDSSSPSASSRICEASLISASLPAITHRRAVTDRSFALASSRHHSCEWDCSKHESK
eukprot:1658105-Rhodomonas_salina.1